MICLLCGEPLTATPWGPVGERGPCRPIDAEQFGVDDEGIHVAFTAAEIDRALTAVDQARPVSSAA